MQTEPQPTTDSKLLRDYALLLLLSKSLRLYLQLESCVHTPYFNERQTVCGLFEKRNGKEGGRKSGLPLGKRSQHTEVCGVMDFSLEVQCLGLFGSIINTKAPRRLK